MERPKWGDAAKEGFLWGIGGEEYVVDEAEARKGVNEKEADLVEVVSILCLSKRYVTNHVVGGVINVTGGAASSVPDLGNHVAN